MGQEKVEAGRLSVQLISITEQLSGQRVDNFLLARLKGVPKSRIYRIIRKGEVRVNKKRVKPEYKLQTDDLLRVPPIRTAQPTQVVIPSEQLQQLLKNSIIYEDDALLIINKPSGLAVHAGTGVKIGMIEALRVIFPEQQQLELVHRLDKGTSGCIMMAKSSKVLRTLNAAFKNGEIKKVYHALVIGRWPKKIDKVDKRLHKFQPRSGERYVEVSEEGKTALTLFRNLQQFKELTLIEARPQTGRTHQIRVHAQFVGCPISGDDKYSSKKGNCILKNQGVSRLCLHANRLSFSHPISSLTVDVYADYDSSFENAINILKNS